MSTTTLSSATNVKNDEYLSSACKLIRLFPSLAELDFKFFRETQTINLHGEFDSKIVSDLYMFKRDYDIAIRFTDGFIRFKFEIDSRTVTIVLW